MKRTMVLRFAAATLMAVALLLSEHVPRAAGASDVAKRSFDRELLKAASELDAAASYLRRNPRAKAAVPYLHVPPAPLGAPPMYSPSLDQWLQSSLAEIRTEKTSKAKARDLKEVASSLRLAAEFSNVKTAPALEPGAEATRILAQRLYQTGGAGPAPAPKETLWERLLRWLSERLDELFRRIFGAAASRPIVGQIIALVFVLLVAAVAAYLIYVLAALLIAKRKPAATDEGAPLQERVDPDALYQSGLAAAAAGHYAQALALLFQASLASFDRVGLLEFDASRTAGEYRRAVRRSLAVAGPHFDAIAHAFVMAAFAERPVCQSDWSTADAAYRSLQPLLPL